MSEESGKFVPEDIFKFLREGELEIINSARGFLKFSNPTNMEKQVLVSEIAKKIDEVSELNAKLKLLSVKSNIKLKKIEILRGDSELKKEDRVYNLINEDSQFMDIFILNKNLEILIDYLNELAWNLRNIIQFYTKTTGN